MNENLSISTEEINPQAVDPKQGDIELSKRLDGIGVSVSPEVIASWSIEEMTEALEYVDSVEAAEMFDDARPDPPKILERLVGGETSTDKGGDEVEEDDAPDPAPEEAEEETSHEQADLTQDCDMFTGSNGGNSQDSQDQEQQESLVPDDTEQAYNQLLFAVGSYLQAQQYAEATAEECRRRRQAMLMLFTAAHEGQQDAGVAGKSSPVLSPETSVSALSSLPPRVRNALRQQGCNTLGDLKAAYESGQLEGFSGIGPAAMDKIRETLDSCLS